MKFYDFNIIINRKNNKNTYLRVDENLNIVISTGYFVTKNKLQKFIDSNEKAILKMIDKQKEKNNRKKDFRYLGNKYEIIYDKNYKSVEINDKKIVAPDEKTLKKWYNKETRELFLERLKVNYNRFDEEIPFPSLRIRTMKTRWGVCNIKTKTVTLNSLLMEYSTEKLDYVIVHELSHLIYFNHSKDFWNLVSKYVPNYKQVRKELKE